MNDNISYVWVTKGDSIPHTEKTHGMLNIINTAQQNRNSKINVYIDSEENQISYTLPPNIEQPKNIKFIPVSHLAKECINKAQKNNHNPKFIDEAYQLYLLEMEHGHPAYAGNFIKLLALYKGGIVSDIGLIYNEKIFLDIQGKIKTNGEKFHSATPPVLFWSSDKQSNSVLTAIKTINSGYTDEDLLSMFSAVIQGTQKKDRILEKIKEIYKDGTLEKNQSNAALFIKSAKLCLEVGVKFQDMIYGSTIGEYGETYCYLPLDTINHKMSHLTATPNYNDNNKLLTSNNSNLEEFSKGPQKIKRTASNGGTKSTVILKELARRKSVSDAEDEYYYNKIAPIGGTQFSKF